MFSQLIESRPARRRSPGGFAASIVLHGILIAGTVIATSHISRRPEPRESAIMLPVIRPTPEPPRVAPVSPSSPASQLPAGPNVINVPIDIPDAIPPVDLARTLIDFDAPTVFRVGSPTHAGNPALPTPEPGAILLAEQVEVPVALDPRSPLPRFPEMLKSAGLDGLARLRFVVDTLGRVELATVQVLESTHPAFTAAVQATLPKLRFQAARVGDRHVRQLVEFPVQFQLRK